MQLTARRIAKLLKTRGRYHDGGGLYLQVGVIGKGSWLLRYERNGRERAMGLGPLADFTLAEARQRAKAARQLLRDGVDPLEAKAAKRAAGNAMTFAQCGRRYFEAHKAEWSNLSHQRQFLQSLEDHAFDLMGGLPVAAIEQRHVLEVLQPIWTSKPTTAGRLRARIEAVLRYAVAAGLRPAGVNPAAWKDSLQPLLASHAKLARSKPKQHHPALPYDEVHNFISKLRTVDGVAARALEFLILTAARSGEVAHAQWSEIDFGNRLWVIPAERMKARAAHRVPLSPLTIELLQALPREADNPFVFIGRTAGQPIERNAPYVALRLLDQEVTVHGFRSTFRTWAGEKTSFPYEVCEAALAHKIGDATARSYHRTDLFDKRCELMNQWATFCSTPWGRTGEVVQLHERVVL